MRDLTFGRGSRRLVPQRRPPFSKPNDELVRDDKGFGVDSYALGFAEDGLIIQKDDGLMANPKGRFLLNAVKEMLLII